MAGEMVAFRRAALGAPIAEYAQLVDRARVNGGGKKSNVAAPTAIAASSFHGVQATASGTANTKGAWAELVASTSFAAETLIITLHESVAGTGVATPMLLDIGIGAAASETVLVPNLLCGYTVTSGSGAGGLLSHTMFIIPIAVAAGTRISCRIQGAVTSDTLTVGLQYRASGFSQAAGVTCTALNVTDSGASTATTSTTVVGAHTKGDWTECISATTAAYRYLLVALQPTSTATVNAADGLVDIGVGAAASETVIVPDIQYFMTSTEQFGYRGCELPFIVNIPVGSRLSCRYQSNSTNINSRPVVALYGIT